MMEQDGVENELHKRCYSDGQDRSADLFDSGRDVSREAATENDPHTNFPIHIIAVPGFTDDSLVGAKSSVFAAHLPATPILNNPLVFR
jgi:hypothetical protein